MIEYLLIINALIIFIYTYIKTKAIFIINLRLLFSGIISSLTTLMIYIMYFYLYKNEYMIYIGLIFIGLLLFTKKYLLDKDKISERVTYLFSLLMNNAIIISVSFIALYISVVKIFPQVFILYQILVIIVGELLLYFIRCIWGKTQTTYLSLITFLIIVLTIFMYWGQYKYSDNYIPHSSNPFKMTLDIEKIAPVYQYFPIIDISVSNNLLYYTQYIAGSNPGYLLKAHNLNSGEVHDVYFISNTSNISNSMIELVDYQEDVLISSALGVYRVEGITVVPLIENNQADLLMQYVDYFQVIYLQDDQLIYESQDGVFTYIDHEFVETTSLPSVHLDGYIPISFYLDYYYFNDDQPVSLNPLMNKDLIILNEGITMSFGFAAKFLKDTVTSFDAQGNIKYNLLNIGDIQYDTDEDFIWITVTNDHNNQYAYLIDMTYSQVIRDKNIDYLISNDSVYRVNEPVLALSDTPFYKIKNIVFITLFIACLPFNLVSLEAIKDREKADEETY